MFHLVGKQEYLNISCLMYVFLMELELGITIGTNRWIRLQNLQFPKLI